MKKEFLYQRIASDLLKGIQNGTYVPGDMLESPEILTKRYQASIITVNKALLSLAEDGYIKRIPGRGSRVEEWFSRSGTVGSKMIGAVVYDMSQPDIWAPAVRAIERYLYPLGYQLLVGNDAGSSERMIEYIDRFSAQGVEGLVFIPLSGRSETEFNAVNGSIISHLSEVGLPYVVMHRVLKKADTVQVGFDNLQDSSELMDTLFKYKSKYPLLLSYPFYNSVIADRERGFFEALWHKGFNNPERSVVRLPEDLFNGRDERVDFSAFLLNEVAKRKQVDTIIAIDDHILKLIHSTIQAGALNDLKSLLFSGFGSIDDVFETKEIDVYQRQDPSVLGEVTIATLLDLVNHKIRNASQILRIPSVLIRSLTE